MMVIMFVVVLMFFWCILGPRPRFLSPDFWEYIRPIVLALVVVFFLAFFLAVR